MIRIKHDILGVIDELDEATVATIAARLGKSGNWINLNIRGLEALGLIVRVPFSLPWAYKRAKRAG